jgi:hypothetical protein
MYDPGDCIEFKHFTSIPNNEPQEYTTRKGRVIDIVRSNLLKVEIIDPDWDSSDRICWINPGSVTEHYPKSQIQSLSLRLLLKKLWKNLIFREVKTVKTKEPYAITHQYINESGFVRSSRYRSVNEAMAMVPPKFHDNIRMLYTDYYGFTTDRIVRSNDRYYDQEIFFSRKCYGELNLAGDNITAKFPPRRGFSMVPPYKKQYVCGLVGKGEKGLFYRKWFVCSDEFLKLWTMIFYPSHSSLRDSNFSPKSMAGLIQELDTSHYNTMNNHAMSIDQKREEYQVHNVESTAVCFPDLYQKIAKAICSGGNKSNTDSMYLTYEEQLHKDLLWMK